MVMTWPTLSASKRVEAFCAVEDGEDLALKRDDVVGVLHRALVQRGESGIETLHPPPKCQQNMSTDLDARFVCTAHLDMCDTR